MKIDEIPELINFYNNALTVMFHQVRREHPEMGIHDARQEAKTRLEKAAIAWVIKQSSQQSD